MKIKETDGTIIDVFSIYWFGDETYFYGLPENYGGLLAYRSSQVSVIDPKIDFDVIYYENNAKSIHHWALIKEKLLDDILERDDVAYNRFLEILKAEGQIEPDFC
nr:hypothetical protein [uncultured Erwinia sp.]